MNHDPEDNRYTELHWTKDGHPLSNQFDDIYFFNTTGLEETQYVFLEHNRLPQRWSKLTDTEHFVIAETGFGTGLNFLSAWLLWKNQAPRNATLHFISVEKYPLKRHDLEKALKLWPQLTHLCQQLLEQYPDELSRDFHHLIFDDQRVKLTLIIDDAECGLEQLLNGSHPTQQVPARAIDAWFLDGFTPAKNPDMWQPELFQLMQKLSHSNTTVATFTAAGVVRRGLIEHGFSIEKKPGYGRKREMLHGHIQKTHALPDAKDFTSSGYNSPHEAPWYCREPQKNTQKNNIAIIGAGLAGCHMARALATRGYQVTLIERHDALAREASGNPQGVLYVKLSHRAETLSEFNLASLQFAQRHYRPFWENSDQLGQQCGVLQLAQSIKHKDAMLRIKDTFQSRDMLELLSPQQASLQAGVELPYDALFFKRSGWLKPAQLCQQLIKHPNIQVIHNHEIARLNQLNGGDWQLYDNRGSLTLSANQVVLCCANQALTLQQTQELPLKPVRGQISQVPADEHSLKLKTVLCGEGYIAPADEQQHCLGASFDLQSTETNTTIADHQQNLTRLSEQFPNLIRNPPAASDLTGRAALRCTTPDYLPLLGPVPNHPAFIKRFELLRKNARAEIPHSGSHHDNLFISAGYGSRGLAYIPLCTEILAAQINGEPIPASRERTKALNPARFIVRNLIRKKI